MKHLRPVLLVVAFMGIVESALSHNAPFVVGFTIAFIFLLFGEPQ